MAGGGTTGFECTGAKVSRKLQDEKRWPQGDECGTGYLVLCYLFRPGLYQAMFSFYCCRQRHPIQVQADSSLMVVLHGA